MRYIKAELSNGYCGFDDSFLMEFPEDTSDNTINSDVMENYVYLNGGGGLDPWDDEDYDDYDDYLDDIYDYSTWEEITEEEYIKLRDEEGWEVR